MMKCKTNDDGDADASVTKITGKGDNGRKIVGGEGDDATKIMGEGDDGRKTAREDSNASKIAGEGGDATVDQKTVSTQMIFVNELSINYLNNPNFDSAWYTSSLEAETKCICELRVPRLDISCFSDEQVSEWKEAYDELVQKCSYVEFVQGSPDLDELQKSKDTPKLLLMDDIP
uniref:Uncharacterized protein n=1 Tax=Romanomermis culicivorax TaxID=13658 RepID=A0A915LA49_ROMCU